MAFIIRLIFFSLIVLRPPTSTLFPYTTLFRSLNNFWKEHEYVVHVPQDLCDALFRRFDRSEEHTSELQSHVNLVCRLLLEKKNNTSTCLKDSYSLPSFLISLS